MVEKGGFLHYDLPEARIAQRPVGLTESRTGARLLYASAGVDEADLVLRDEYVAKLCAILRPGDLLVLNDSKVIPCRFFAKNLRDGKEVEILLIYSDRANAEAEDKGMWESLARPMRRIHQDDLLFLSEHLKARVLGRSDDGRRLRLELVVEDSSLCLEEILELEGVMPIPPYIRGGKADESDRELYQTTFAKSPGSVAAPTAGLHFTPELLAQLQNQGIDHRFITLHVGPASFLPVATDEVSQHRMLPEYYTISLETRQRLKRCKEDGGRVIGVGTTVVRALEGDALGRVEGVDESSFQETNIFITPGFQFQVIDALITNFHQPGTTHLLLVAAYIGKERTEAIYQHALAHEYRFLSYGDSMFLERS